MFYVLGTVYDEGTGGELCKHQPELQNSFPLAAAAPHPHPTGESRVAAAQLCLCAARRRSHKPPFQTSRWSRGQGRALLPRWRLPGWCPVCPFALGEAPWDLLPVGSWR